MSAPIASSGRLTKKARAELEAWAMYGRRLHEGLTKAGANIVEYTCGCTYVVGVGLPVLNAAHVCTDRVAVTLGPQAKKLTDLGAKISVLSGKEAAAVLTKAIDRGNVS
jgi:hypothetical protein